MKKNQQIPQPRGAESLAFLGTNVYFAQSLGGRTLLWLGVYRGETNKKHPLEVENHLSSNTSLIGLLISSKIGSGI